MKRSIQDPIESPATSSMNPSGNARRTPDKLALRRETLRVLTGSELSLVFAAGPGDPEDTYATTFVTTSGLQPTTETGGTVPTFDCATIEKDTHLTTH